MKLQIAREGTGFSVEGEWQDSRHRSRQLGTEITPEVSAALDVLLTWADEKERELSIDSIAYDNLRRLEEERDELQARINKLAKKK
jgi:hypothetical protein